MTPAEILAIALFVLSGLLLLAAAVLMRTRGQRMESGRRRVELYFGLRPGVLSPTRRPR